VVFILKSSVVVLSKFNSFAQKLEASCKEHPAELGEYAVLVKRFSCEHKLNLTKYSSRDEIENTISLLEQLIKEDKEILPESLYIDSQIVKRRLEFIFNQLLEAGATRTKYNCLTDTSYANLCTDKKFESELKVIKTIEEFGKMQEEYTGKLTKEEKEAILSYGCTGYRFINEALRNGKINQYAESISKVMLVLKKPLKVYKGLHDMERFYNLLGPNEALWSKIADDPILGKFKINPASAKYLKDQILYEKGFMSTSVSKEVAYRFANESSCGPSCSIVLVIQVSPGVRYWPLMDGKDMFSRPENEILLDKGIKLQIDDIKFKNEDKLMVLKCHNV
jgi:hypothetical protein